MGLGIDFGYSSLKMIELEKTDQQFTLKNIGLKPIYDDMNRFDPENISKTHWVSAIQNLSTELNIQTKKIKNVISSLSGSKVSIQQLTTLEMGKEELDQSLEFEAKKHIPLDGTEAIIDYHIMGQDQNEIDKVNVLLVATTKNTVTQHNQILLDSGYKSNIYDTDAIALMNCYQHNYEQADDGADVILNIGNQSSTLVVNGKSLPFFTREINISGYHFTKYLVEKNNSDYETAENFKINNGMENKQLAGSEDEDTSTADTLNLGIAEKSILTNLTDEIRKTLRFYVKSNNQVFFNKFYLSGGSAMLPGLKEFIAENLNVDVEIFNPFQNISSDNVVENPPQYAIAVGLALHGTEAK